MQTIRRTRTPRVAPLELFYDLVFVVVIQQLSGRLASAPEALGYLAVVGLTVAIWLCWLNQLLLMNQARVSTAREIALVFLAVAGLGVIAISFGDPAEWDPQLFVLGYVVTRTALWPLWSRTRMRRSMWTPFVFGPVLAALWLATLALPAPLMLGGWVILVVVEVAIVITGLPSVEHDAAHLVERVGLFVLILLGDCIAETVTAVSPDSPPTAWLVAAASFATTCLIWVAYFALGPFRAVRTASGAAPGYVRDVILLGHLLLVLGLLLLAAGFNSAIDHATAPTAPAATRIGVSSGLLLILAAQALTALRDGASLRWIALWFIPLAIIAAVPLSPIAVVDGIPSLAVACSAVGVQVAVVLALRRERGRIRPRPKEADVPRPFRE